ncbi:hypothetical protein HK098_003913 [Nowakowskiella sp. JEL0407]|nr:hypothetical protein HK098_003913 [Nowakowskiella sp. JEL0407]
MNFKPTTPGYFAPASWSFYLTIKVVFLRFILTLIAGNIDRTQRLSKKHINPHPKTVTITATKIPRSKLSLDGFEADNDGEIDAEWVYASEAEKNSTVILYIHGGAFITGSPQAHRGLTSSVAIHSKCRLLAIDYRKSPQYVFPSALFDCVSAYLHLVKTEGIDEKNIVIAGDSAGGNLTISTALYLREHANRLGVKMPAGLVSLSPWVDLTHSQPSIQLNREYDYLSVFKADPKYTSANRSVSYVTDNSMREHPLISPMFATIDSSLNGEDVLELPPMLVQAGSLELLYHEILVFVGKSIKESQSEVTLQVYEDMPHVHQLIASRDYLAKVAVEQIGLFVRSVTPGDNQTKSSTRSYKMIKNIRGKTTADFVEMEIDPLEIVESARKAL